LVEQNSRHHLESLSSVVGIQEQRQAWPLLRDAEKDSFGTGTETDGHDVPIKTKMLPSDQTKWFYPTLEDHIAIEPSLQQQQGWLTAYEHIRKNCHSTIVNYCLPVF
jgi:hypothetical protein